MVTELPWPELILRYRTLVESSELNERKIKLNLDTDATVNAMGHLNPGNNIARTNVH
jgi:hypothetical protein